LLCNSAVQFARPILRSENQERRHLAWGPVQHAAQRVRRRCLTQNCRRVLRYTFGIVPNNPRRLVILQNLPCFLPIVAKEKSRAVRKIDRKNAIQTAPPDLIGSSKRGSANAKTITKKYPQRACQIVRT